MPEAATHAARGCDPADALLPDVCRVEDIARHVDAHPATVRRWCAAGVLPAVRVGRRWLVAREALILRLGAPDWAAPLLRRALARAGEHEGADA